jgi:hypothetical protein
MPPGGISTPCDNLAMWIVLDPQRWSRDHFGMTDSSHPASTSFQEAADRLRALGVTLGIAPGEFIVNFRNGAPVTEYRTDDLADALEHGFQMGEAKAEPPPLGPMGKGQISKRARMYRHNRGIAARRRKTESQ